MAKEDLGPWEPISVDRIVALFDRVGFRWWISGGHALEAHLGESWRSHDDVDVGIVRTDAPRLPEALPDWDIHVAAAGVLTSWDGGCLDARKRQNNLWARRPGASAWGLDVTISDGNADEWIYRREPRIRCPWTEAILTTTAGVPYLAPELQLLFKSKDVRPKDDLDAASVLPRLEPERRTRLGNWLPADHPWQPLTSPT